MKPFTLATALFSCLAAVRASSSASSQTSDSGAPFKPPQVFKNANLVHIISVEKNYAKETINVQIENIDKEPQDAYYLPFPSDLMARVGGLEVKDRKDQTVGPFATEIMDFDPSRDTQYYKIILPAPLAPGAQQTLGIGYYVLKAYSPLPVSIKQDEKQYLVYPFNAYAPSAYTTTKQKTEVKFPGSIEDYTKLPGSGGADEFPVKAGSKLTYGPFPEVPAGAVEPAKVRFEFTKPVLHVASLNRDIEVSHWGGNVAFEERYTLLHRGANLSSLFNRVKWAQSAYFNPASYALKEMKFSLRAGSVDPYYTDVIGNVSTSRFRPGKRDALLEAKPRYPVFGGWKYPFTIGWNSDAKSYLRRLGGEGYVLNVPFLEGPRQSEGVEYERVTLRVLLPEGATNIKFDTALPASSIVSHSVDLHKTYLDTLGRTTLTITASNIVDDFRDRELIVTYDYPFTASLRKPMVVFVSMLGVFIVAYVIGGVEVKFASKKK